MKNSWIVFAGFAVIAWSGTAYAASAQQASGDGKPGQQVQSAAHSGNPAAAAKQVGSQAAPASSQPVEVKPKGSYMLVELSHGLKAQKLKVGDTVKAEVSQAVISHGKVVIPAETKLLGHVTEVSARDSGRTESRLGIVFDRILLTRHQQINFTGVVQSVSQAVVRRSLVDQPSQMLPPSMAGGGSRSPVITGRGGSSGLPNSGGVAQSASGGSASASTIITTAPIVVKNSPSPRHESVAATLETDSSGKPLSIGTPQGVTGIKGLSLSADPSPNTPGPVIVSNTANVKLDSGTQILLHILNVEVPAVAKPAK